MAVSLAVAACGVSTGSPSASAVPPDVGAPVQRTVERDGVIVTLALDADRVAAGDPLRAMVRVLNVAPGIVFWQGGGCDLLQDLSLGGPPLQGAPIAQPPPGRDPAAVAGLVKWAATADGVGHTGFRPADLPPDVVFGCDSDLRVNELEFGDSEMVEAIWPGTTSDTIPAPSGSYVARVTFPFLARQVAGPFTGDAIADQRPMEVEAQFEVFGDAWTGLSAAEALDAVLADPQVRRWIERDLPRERVGGARARLDEATHWRIEIDLSAPSGDTEGVAVILVDARSAKVEIVDLGP